MPRDTRTQQEKTHDEHFANGTIARSDRDARDARRPSRGGS
jgi:hypothetical protein